MIDTTLHYTPTMVFTCRMILLLEWGMQLQASLVVCHFSLNNVKVTILIQSVSYIEYYSSLVTTLLNIFDCNLTNIEASPIEKGKNVIQKVTSGTNSKEAFYFELKRNFSSNQKSKFNSNKSSKGKCTCCVSRTST